MYLNSLQLDPCLGNMKGQDNPANGLVQNMQTLLSERHDVAASNIGAAMLRLENGPAASLNLAPLGVQGWVDSTRSTEKVPKGESPKILTCKSTQAAMP